MNDEANEPQRTAPSSDPQAGGPEHEPQKPSDPLPSGPDPHQPQTSNLRPEQETRSELADD